MKTRLTSAPVPIQMVSPTPMRAWYAGLPTREAVARYLARSKGQGRSARGVLGQVRRALVAAARRAHRNDLAARLAHPANERMRQAKSIAQAIEVLRHAQPPEPQIADPVEQWFPARAVRALNAQGIVTLADLTVRVPRRRRWWKTVSDLGATSAEQIEAFFVAHPARRCGRAPSLPWNGRAASCRGQPCDCRMR